jgi:hypothetical protein
MNKFTNEDSSESMSLIKKNIKRKHEKNYILDDCSTYKNLHEMMIILKINNNQIKTITKSIET